MKSANLFAAAAILALLSACNGNNTRIDGSLSDAAAVPDAVITLCKLDGSRTSVLDSAKVAADGSYRFRLQLEKGKPEFLYLYRGETKLASLLLEAGDKVAVNSDPYGLDYGVSGSAESEKLRQVEKDYAGFRFDIDRIAQHYASVDGDPAGMKEVSDAIKQSYINYYRDRVKYVLSNAKSLTVVPVLFQELDGTSIFNQPTDALLFRAAADSLKTVYPASRYVRSLEGEAVRREQMMDLDYKIRHAEQASYIDIELPDVQGNKVKLSETAGKVVLVYFWSTADAAQKMFNIDQMLPIYQDYQDKGLEIYAVSLDTDKTAWATAVRSQELPWVNVCDSRGTASPYLSVYNVRSLPAIYFLVDGEMVGDPSVTGAQALRKFLAARLK